MRQPVILYKYISMEFLKIYFFALIFFTAVMIISMFFDEFNDLLEYKAGILYVLQYFGYKVPYTMLIMSISASSLATLFSLSMLAKNNEITAMKTGKISLFKIILPVLVISLLISILSLIIHEAFAAKMFSESKLIKYNKILKTGIIRSSVKNNLVFKSQEGWIVYTSSFQGDIGLMKDITIIFTDKKNALLKRIDAKEAKWNGENWEAKDCYIRKFINNKEQFTKYLNIKLPITEKPEDFVKKKEKFEEFTIKELNDEVNKLKESGAKYKEELMHLNFKISYPFANFMLTLLGIPFALMAVRHGGMIFSFVVSVFVVFIYWGFLTAGLALGKNGILPPTLAAWAANIIFFIIGTIMIYKIK